jgi:predicted amidohydrolase YtcJ
VRDPAYSEGQLLGPDEALSPRAALGLYTRGSARLRCGRPAAGTLRPGEPADVIAVADDPRTRAGLEQMQTRDVMATIVGGELVHDAATTASPTR